MSDSHLGFNQYGLSQRGDDFGRQFAEIVALAVAEEVDFVVHSGNLFHHATPNVRALKHILALRELQAAGIPFFVIRGHRDASIRSARGNLLEVLAELQLVTYLEDETHVQAFNGHEVALLGLGYHGRRVPVFLKRALTAATAATATRVPDGALKLLVLNSPVRALTTRADTAPLALEDLPAWDYVAVGGATRRFEAPAAHAYAPGPPEYLGFRDAAAATAPGVYLVEWDPAADPPTRVTWHETGARPLVSIAVNVQAATLEAAVTQVEEALELHDEPGALISAKVYGVLTSGRPGELPVAELKRVPQRALKVLQVQNLLHEVDQSAPDAVDPDAPEVSEIDLIHAFVAGAVKPGTSSKAVDKVTDLTHGLLALFEDRGSAPVQEMLAVLDATLKDAPVNVDEITPGAGETGETGNTGDTPRGNADARGQE